jgi:hypothetical protein
MTRSSRFLVGLVLALGLVLIGSVGTAGAAASAVAGGPTISGCTGSAKSIDSEGEVLADATGAPPSDLLGADGKPIFTSGNPFPVSPDGDVEWSGDSTSLIVDGTWTMKVWGYTVDEGPALNRERATQKAGTYSLDGVLPFDAPGVALVEVTFDGEGGTCRGTGFVKVTGSPALTTPWLAGAGLALAGLGLLFFAQPKQVWGRG